MLKNYGPYHAGQFQDYLTMKRFFKRKGITDDMIKKEIAKLKAEAVKNSGMPPCPICGAMTIIMKVNNSPRTQIGGNYKSAWICYDRQCGHEKYSELNAKEFYREIKK